MSLETKSCESDILPTFFLKNHLDKLLSSLTNRVNLSVQNVIFADQWKLAILRPFIKKLNSDLVISNYRPVSNILFMAKVVEKVALTQLNKFSSGNYESTSFQSAYKARQSCETAILKINIDALQSMESQKVMALVLIDLSAAFVMVDHQILLEIFE